MEPSQDVLLIIEGESFPAKKNILSAVSDYFRAMFSGNYVEKELKEVNIDVVDANSMRIILKYLDLGLIDLSDYPLHTIGELAKATNFLQITQLKKQLEYWLETQLSLHQWVEIMTIAENAFYSKLQQNAAIYGLNKFNDMDPKYMPSIETLFWYLSHPHLDVDNELKVFEFGIKWVKHYEAGADAILIILDALDMNRLKANEIKEMQNLVKDYTNSLAEKIIDCLYKLSTDFELTVDAVEENKLVLCEQFTGRVHTEVLNIIKESTKRNLPDLMATVPLWLVKNERAGIPPHDMYSFRPDKGFEKWLGITDKNLWGWSVASWSPSRIVVVGGEYGRGTGVFGKAVRVFDVYKKEWTEHGTDMPSRRHAGVAILEDSLFLIGGVGGFRELSKLNETIQLQLLAGATPHLTPLDPEQPPWPMVVLDTAHIYNLNEMTHRKIARFPDAIQNPAVCVHDNAVYASGQKNVYKYEDFGETDCWTNILETDMRPKSMVSFKGYIYMTQNFYGNLYRFRPTIDTVLELIATFSNSAAAICNMRDRLYIFSGANCAASDETTVSEYKGEEDGHKVNIIYSQPNTLHINDVAGCCAVSTRKPKLKPNNISEYHKKHLTSYAYATQNE